MFILLVFYASPYILRGNWHYRGACSGDPAVTSAHSIDGDMLESVISPH